MRVVMSCLECVCVSLFSMKFNSITGSLPLCTGKHGSCICGDPALRRCTKILSKFNLAVQTTIFHVGQRATAIFTAHKVRLLTAIKNQLPSVLRWF